MVTFLEVGKSDFCNASQSKYFDSVCHFLPHEKFFKKFYFFI